ncbi:MAG: porin [Pseudomonadota bacterium]
MKKVLFATTALIASAGIASAQGVAVSGYAEMGIAGGDRYAVSDAQFWQDIDVTFTMSGETDNGLTFGASVDLDEAQDTCDLDGADDTINTADDATSCGNAALDDPFDDGGVAVFISGDFGRLTLGDTDGALDRVMQDAVTAGGPGTIADDESEHAGYLGAFSDGVFDGQILAYEYSFGDFLFVVSHEQDVGGGDGTNAIGVRYSTSFGAADITAGLGFLSADDGGDNRDIVGLSVLAELDSGFSGVIGYSDWTGIGATDTDDNHTYIGLGYSIDAISVHVNYGEFDSGASGYGFAAAYDLGGGASIHFGYGAGEASSTAATIDSYSFGLAMSF